MQQLAFYVSKYGVSLVFIKLVRPLAGGLDAWVAAGYAVDADPLLEAPEGADAAAHI